MNSRNDLFSAHITIIRTLTSVAPIIHIVLTCTAIISVYSKTLTKLASHGKTKLQQEVDTDSHHKTANTSQGGFVIPLIHRIQFFVDDNLFQVNKRRFTDFYIIGLFWTTYILFLCQHYGSESISLNKNLFSILLLYMHLCRRAYECKYVHVWNGTMHIAGWILGLLHYILLPLLFIPTMEQFITNNEMGGVEGQNWPDKKVQIIFLSVMNIYFQYEQHTHHIILAKSREIGKEGQNVYQKANKSKRYTIQFGRWFQYVSCPHYTAEIMIYITFVLSISVTKGQRIDSSDTKIWYIIQYFREWILVLWVFTNLTVSAKNSHSWYKSYFTDKYPKNRKALIPFLW